MSTPTIKTPLMFGDAAEMAVMALTDRSPVDSITRALMAVDEASRAQAREDIQSGMSPLPAEPASEETCIGCGALRSQHVATEDQPAGRCEEPGCDCTASPEDDSAFERKASPALAMLLLLQYVPHPLTPIVKNLPSTCRGCGRTSGEGCAPACEMAAAILDARSRTAVSDLVGHLQASLQRSAR